MYVGICRNHGLTVKQQEAIDYALKHCGIRVVCTTEETQEFLEMLEEWYFSGNWVQEPEEIHIL